jgi:hypothetical protein
MGIPENDGVTMRGFAAMAMVLGFLAGGAAAQDPAAAGSDPCAQCRMSADTEQQKCEAAAKDAAARATCAKRGAEASLSCDLVACKAGPRQRQADGTCPGCQNRVSEEERSCRLMPPGSSEQMLCTQRAGRLRTECDTTVCKTAPK